MDAPVEVANQAQLHRAERELSGKISFENVSFGYVAGKTRADEVSVLKQNQGQIVGIFGMTGAGKTTLLGCYRGFTTPRRGRAFSRWK